MEEKIQNNEWNETAQSDEILQELKAVKQIIQIYTIIRIILLLIIMIALIMISVGISDMTDVMVHYLSHSYGCHGIGY